MPESDAFVFADKVSGSSSSSHCHDFSWLCEVKGKEVLFPFGVGDDFSVSHQRHCLLVVVVCDPTLFELS